MNKVSSGSLTNALNGAGWSNILTITAPVSGVKTYSAQVVTANIAGSVSIRETVLGVADVTDLYAGSDATNIAALEWTIAAGDSSITLEINVTGSASFSGSWALYDTTSIDSNIVTIDSDSTSATNLKSQYNGTGLTGATYPSTQSQVGLIGTTGAAAYQAAASFDKQIGGTETGTYANTDTSNGIYHQIADNAGVMDIRYTYNLRPDEVAVGVVFKGRMSGTGDNVVCQAYDWISTNWITLFTVTGVNTTTDQTNTPALVAKYTGTSAPDVGKVQIRFYAASGLTSANMYVDQLIVAKASNPSTTGYVNGSIWVKTAGLSGTTIGYNGTADNPCPWADALSINATLGLNRYQIEPGNTVTLGATLQNSVISGDSFLLALGGQDISGTTIKGCETLSGTATSSVSECFVLDSHVTTVSVGEIDFHRCHLMSTVTMTQASVPYLFHGCVGVSAAKIVFAAANQSAVIGKWSGPITIAGMVSTNTLYIDGSGDVTIDATNTGGIVYISGTIRLTNNGSGQTIIDTARFAEDQSLALVTNLTNAPSNGDLTSTMKSSITTLVDNSITSSGIGADVDALITTVGVAGAGLTNIGDTRLAYLNASVASRLAPTVAGRTLDVNADGEAGIDWANIGNPTTSVNFSGSTFGTVTTLTNLPSIPLNWLTGSGIDTTAVTKLQANLATSSVLTDVKAQTDKLTFTGTDVKATLDSETVVLASNGLDNIAVTAPSGPASTFREMVVQLWRRFFKKATITSSQLKTYADNGSTVITTQAVSDDTTTQTVGDAS